MARLVSVILSGGAGTRLWPLSRAERPKQFIDLSGSGMSLLQDTLARVRDTKRFAPPLVICNNEHRFMVAEQLRHLGMDDATIVLEPVGRNTAPAVTLAALVVAEQYGKDAVMLVMPSDQAIQKPEALLRAVRRAAMLAQQGALVTFGITPLHAETGYGYIQYGAPLDTKETAYHIARFVEKPDLKTAARYVQSGKYAWNSGMFAFAAGAYLQEAKRLTPDIYALCRKALGRSRRDLAFIRPQEKAFAALPSISLDHAIMERTRAGVVIPLACGWCDLGSWESLWQTQPKDARGNVQFGETTLVDTHHSYIRGEEIAVAVLGASHLVVVATKDAVLVADQSRAQDMGALVQALRKQNAPLMTSHRRVFRPWGAYEAVDAGPCYQVKRLSIKPQEALSLQLHRHRAEHWVIVRGTARVTIGKRRYTLTANQSIYIPMGMKHRLENIGDGALDIIEVQTGTYLGEDDIVRFEDKYNR